MNQKILSVSAVVPVYNESKTLASVLDVLLSCSKIDEIVVVNDGSEDNSWKLIQDFGDKVVGIDLKKNKGKGFALATGIEEARGDIVLFCDADFVNLQKKHVSWMLDPVLCGVTRVALGYPVRARYVLPIWSHLTGERVYFRKDLLPLLAEMKKSRFGVEILLNDAFRKVHMLKVPLPGLNGLYKYEKQTTDTALKEYLNAAVEIGLELARQTKLKTRDLKLMQELTRTRDLPEIVDKVKEIGNTNLRLLLEKYLAEYFEKARTWLDIINSR